MQSLNAPYYKYPSLWQYSYFLTNLPFQVTNAIKAQPKLQDNLSMVASHFLSIFHTMHQRCRSSLEVIYFTPWILALLEICCNLFYIVLSFYFVLAVLLTMHCMFVLLLRAKVICFYNCANEAFENYVICIDCNHVKSQ